MSEFEQVPGLFGREGFGIPNAQRVRFSRCKHWDECLFSKHKHPEHPKMSMMSYQSESYKADGWGRKSPSSPNRMVGFTLMLPTNVHATEENTHIYIHTHTHFMLFPELFTRGLDLITHSRQCGRLTAMGRVELGILSLLRYLPRAWRWLR